MAKQIQETRSLRIYGPYLPRPKVPGQQVKRHFMVRVMDHGGFDQKVFFDDDEGIDQVLSIVRKRLKARQVPKR